MIVEPLNNHDARKLIRQIVQGGTVIFTVHAQTRMKERDIPESSVLHALKAGWVDGCDFECGSWRYRVMTVQITVVVAFDDETKAIVITTWE